ncbi:MAG: hypothetical protein JWL85_906 [Candidatus Saccharibacteria bacterium]|nr:hypothetical protein [Candidatus Saccharibacteria bacterium]
MNISLRNDERGIAHVVLVAIIVVVLGVVGLVGWRITQKGTDAANSSLSDVVKQAAAKCDLDDKDLCKFYASWKENKYYKINTVTTADGKTSNSTYESVGSDRFRMTTSGEMSYEMITIGTTTYTKDPADGKWWKQTLKAEQQKEYSMSDDLKFEEPAKDKPEAEKTVYKKLGKEACGNLTCFKYQVIDPARKDQTEHIWFDDKDYQLRRSTTESASSKSEMTFSYDKININEPSPVKELSANQAVIPGQSEPTTMPSEAEMQQMMQNSNQ